MIVDNSPDRSYFFPLFLERSVCLRYKELPDLVKKEGSDYPNNPKGGKYKELWSTISMTELILNKTSNAPYKAMVCNKVESLLYDKVTENVQRISKAKESFIKAVLHLALSNGFDGYVISVDERDLIRYGLKKDAAKKALELIHDKGGAIHMHGYGYFENEIRKSAPTAFMIYPEMDNYIHELITQLECCKLSIADIKEIQLPKDLIIKR